MYKCMHDVDRNDSRVKLSDDEGSVTVAKSSLAHSGATPATQSVVKTAEM